MGFWDKKNAQRDPFADKDLLIENGVVFRIIGAEYAPPKKYETGQLIIKCETINDGTPITSDMTFIAGSGFNIGLPWNDARADLMEMINATVADGEIIEAELYTFQAKGGTAYDIRQPEAVF